MKRPHKLNCECEHCAYTNWAVRETMIERDKIIKQYHDAITEAFKELCKSYGGIGKTKRHANEARRILREILAT